MFTDQRFARTAILAAAGIMNGVLLSPRATAAVTGYAYDCVENRRATTNVFRFYDATVFSASSLASSHGGRTNILGRNLPESGIMVTFSGVPGTIISAAPMVITVEVPAGAMTGPLVVTLPDETQFDLGEFRVQGIVVTPDEAMIVVEQSLCFEAALTGLENELVSWEVQCPAGAEEGTNCGTITAIIDVDGKQKGCYSPPGKCDSSASSEVVIETSVASVGTYTLMATPRCVSTRDPITVAWTAPPDGVSSTDWIALYPQGAPNTAFGTWFYTGGATSGSRTISAPTTEGIYEFRYLLNDGFEDVTTSNPVAVGADFNTSGEAIIKASVGHVTAYARVLNFGTVGDPGPLTALLVGQTDSALMGHMTVAVPMVSVILPAGVGVGFPVSVALPPILTFLFGEQPGESPPNTTVAEPPVTVEFEPATTLESEEPP